MRNLTIPLGKKLVILDLDRTLVKLNVNWPSCRVEVKQFFEQEYGLIFPNGTTVQKMEYGAFQKFGKEAVEKAMPIRGKYEENALVDAKINEELVELIKKLHEKGMVFAVHSNNLRKVTEDFLEEKGIKDKIMHLVALDDTFAPKPDPTGLKKILEKSGIGAEDAISIGDNPETDGKTAEAVGIEYVKIIMD